MCWGVALGEVTFCEMVITPENGASTVLRTQRVIDRTDMGWQFTLAALPLFAATLVATVVAAVVLRKRDAPGAKALAAIAVAADWWSLTAGLELLTTDPITSVLLTKGSYVGIAIVPLAWVVFVLEYTGRRDWLTDPRLGLLAVVPTITVLAALTNEPAGVHSLFWEDLAVVTNTTDGIPDSLYGPLFWVHAAYSYSLLAIGSYLLVKLLVTADDLYRTQAGTLLLRFSRRGERTRYTSPT